MGSELLQAIQAHLTKNMRLSQPAIERLLVLARRNIGQNIHQLVAQLDADPDQAVRAAHALKGNLANLGLTDLSHKISKLEQDIREGRFDEVRQRVLGVDEALEVFINRDTTIRR